MGGKYKAFFYGGVGLTPEQYTEWINTQLAGYATPTLNNVTNVDLSKSDFRQYVLDQGCNGWLVNIHALRFIFVAGQTVAGGGTDAMYSETEHGCCWQLGTVKLSTMCQPWFDQPRTFSQTRLEVCDIVGGPVCNQTLPSIDPRETLGVAEEFAPLIAGGGATYGKGAYPGRTQLSPDYRHQWWQTSFNANLCNRAAAGTQTGTTTLELVIPTCVFSGTAANDCLPAEAFIDTNNPLLFPIKRVQELLGTLIPTGNGAAVSYQNFTVMALCSFTQMGDPRPVGVPYSTQPYVIGDQTNMQFPSYPYVAIVHSGIYDATTADAPSTSILYAPCNYTGATAAKFQLFDCTNNRIWPHTSNPDFQLFRQFLMGWNRQAVNQVRWPRIAEPVDYTAGTGATASVASRWTRAGGLAGARSYDTSDGRLLIRGYTSDAMPVMPVAYNNFAASGFPIGFGGFNGGGTYRVQLQNYTMPNNGTGAAASVNLVATVASPDEVPGNINTDRYKWAGYAAFGIQCCGKTPATPSMIRPALDGPTAKLPNVMPLVPWFVDTSKYPNS